MATKFCISASRITCDNYNLPTPQQELCCRILKEFWSASSHLHFLGYAMPLQISLTFPSGEVQVTYMDADDVSLQLHALTVSAAKATLQSLWQKSPPPFVSRKSYGESPIHAFAAPTQELELDEITLETLVAERQAGIREENRRLSAAGYTLSQGVSHGKV